jgi:hypothetical protein
MGFSLPDQFIAELFDILAYHRIEFAAGDPCLVIRERNLVIDDLDGLNALHAADKTAKGEGTLFAKLFLDRDAERLHRGTSLLEMGSLAAFSLPMEFQRNKAR